MRSRGEADIAKAIDFVESKPVRSLIEHPVLSFTIEHYNILYNVIISGVCPARKREDDVPDLVRDDEALGSALERRS